MKINTQPKTNITPIYRGHWGLRIENALDRFDKALGKLINPIEFVTKENQTNITKCIELANKLYNPTSPQTINLNIKNGNKEFEFLYNNSAWHKIRLTKKGQELNEFEILHVKNDKDFSFYSTGNYPCQIRDEKYLKKFNLILEDWLPRLIKKYEGKKSPINIIKKDI